MSDSTAIDDFIAELRRRSVIKVAAIYAAIAWFILQFADIAFPRMGLPDWTITVTLVVAAVGFPVAITIAWLLEHSADGLRATGKLTDEQKAQLPKGRKLDLVIIGVLSALVGFLYLERFTDDTATTETTDVEQPVAIEAAPVDESKSIAVMPFENLSSIADNAYFAAGVHEDVLTHLSKISDIKVISRTSVLKYMDKGAKTILEIGRELGVSHVLEGSVRREGDQVRITVQLIDARTDSHVWSESYDRKLDNIFAVQSDVAKQVAKQLQIELDPETVNRVEAVPTQNVAAYDLYLRGRAAAGVFEAGGARRQLRFFERAAQADPDFALAHAGIAINLNMQSILGLADWRDVRERAQASADRALMLDPLSGDAHMAKALLFEREDQYPGAEQELRLAVGLGPNNADAHFQLGRVLFFQGKSEESRPILERAIELDPLADAAPLLLAQTYIRTDPKMALAVTRKALEVNPDFIPGLIFGANAAIAVNDLNTAFDYLFHAVRIEPENLLARNFLVFQLINIEEFDLAEAEINEAMRLAPENAIVYAIRLNLASARAAHSQRYKPESVAIAREWLEKDPDDALANRYFGDSYRGEIFNALQNENPGKAHRLRVQSLGYYEKSVEPYKRDDGTYIYEQDSAWAIFAYARTLIAVAREEEGRTIFMRLLPELEKSNVTWARYQTFIAYAYLGERDNALDALEDALDHGWSSTYIIELHTLLEPLAFLRNDLRFNDLKRRVEERNRGLATYVNSRSNRL